MKLKILIPVLFLIACNSKTEEHKINKALIRFNSYTVMDVDQIIALGEDGSKSIYSDKFNPQTDTILYDKGVIHISYLSIVNGCAEYTGDIEMKDDSIILKLINKGIECTEPRCDRLIFDIKNDQNKKYKIKKW